ncbi:MAG: hypothetical protein AABZ29_02560 [Gemmatimonadota bacterium]
MLPDPLHPAIVHFPVVLSVLIPLVAVGALWAIRLGARPTRAWGVTTGVAAALALSAWAAVQTGEQQEERVEDVVAESRVEQHAEAGETLLFTSAGLLAVIALGLMPGRTGRISRLVGAAGTLVVVAVAYRVGSSGGDLVYKYNAGAVYATPSGTGAAGGEAGESKKGGAGAEKRETGGAGEKSVTGEKKEEGEKGER